MAKKINSYADLAPNNAYVLDYEEYLDDIKTAGIVLKHKKSGARICLLPNDDENKLFCAAFRTPPENSTGVPHIIEHTVLNGSKNYPSRDPFMQLAKGSLNTFLNAMTYPDKTMYPVASCNDKDFINLMGVYMDAVFYPNIYKYRQIFMQEGWHYELEDENDELKINGVVYSEMKGAMSSPDGAVWDAISECLLPDTTYGVNSGGDPEVIPSLTYEYYLDFHRRCYHPANSYIFLYGNCDMDERLEWMDKNYLSSFDEIVPHSDVVKQPRRGTNEPVRATKYYSVGESEETEGKAYLAFATLGGSGEDALECRAWSALTEVLLNTDGAPLREALNDAGIGEDIYGGYDSHMIEDSFSVVAKNAKAEDAERFREIIISTLEKVVKEGVNADSLLAYLNRSEFRFRESDYGGYPRGLDYAANMLQSWLYDDKKAFEYMHTLSDFAELKKRIGTGYYEDLIRRHVLDSDQTVLLTLLPERGLVARKEAELKEKLAAYKASLSADEIEKIIDDTKALREYQSRPATEEELNCIPSIERSDIPLDTIPYYNEERTIGGFRGVFHDIDTNGITYATLLFGIEKIPHKYVPYLSLLSGLLTRLDTDKYSYSDLDIAIRLNTGHLGFGKYTVRRRGSGDEYEPYYSIGMRVLADKAAWALETAADIAVHTDFSDKDRIKIILGEIKSDKQRAIMNNGNSVAAARARSYYSKLACYSEALDGIDYYFFIKDLLDNYDEKADEIAENLKKVAAYVFNPANLLISLAADDNGYKAVEEALPVFASVLNEAEHISLGAPEEYVPVKKNEAVLIPSQVQYSCVAGNLGFDGNKYNGVYQVVRTAVNIDWLYQQIRVKGGAYGCGVGFGGEDGNVTFTSYRDPKLTETYDAFRGTGDFVRTVKFDEKELTKYIIGTFSGYERPMSPAGKASRSFNAYLTGTTYEDTVRNRAEMLGVTEEQFREAADVFDKINAQGYICSVGNESKLRENSELFDNMVVIN